jgi:hypothetical protein
VHAPLDDRSQPAALAITPDAVAAIPAAGYVGDYGLLRTLTDQSNGIFRIEG